MTMRVRVGGLLRIAGPPIVAAMVLAGTSPAWAGSSTGTSTSGVWAVRTRFEVAGTVESPAGARIRPDGMWFLVVRVRIDDGPTRLVLTNAATPAALLKALGIHVHGRDRVAPPMSRPLSDGDVIQVTRFHRVEAVTTTTVTVSHGTEHGQASWYARSGMCAASLSLPHGTHATVTDTESGRSVAVIIDDSGPYGVPGRIIDLCQTAFARLAPLGTGVLTVTVGW
jgi:Lytic transglycolase